MLRILGHGSWAEDPKYGEMLMDLEQETGYQEEGGAAKVESFLIPTHSHLMSAWVYAGIFGAAFWFYVLYLVLRTISWLVTLPPTIDVLLFVSYGRCFVGYFVLSFWPGPSSCGLVSSCRHLYPSGEH